MTTETSPPNSTETTATNFGRRLQTAREALGLEPKDTAAQLRLNESVILMLERDFLASTLPITFTRGYLRTYAKLLQIPEAETAQALECLKPQFAPQASNMPSSKQSQPLTSSHYFMQTFTYLIAVTLIGLVGVWWYTHTPVTPTALPLAENHIRIPEEAAAQPAAPSNNPSAAVAATTPSVTPDTKLAENTPKPTKPSTPPATEQADDTENDTSNTD